MTERKVRTDGSIQATDGIISPVSLGVPFAVAELLGKPTTEAVLDNSKFVGTTVKETWSLDGEAFQTDQDLRFVWAERNNPIGKVVRDGQPVLVYQKRPPRL